jgi:hypothetical protein
MRVHLKIAQTGDLKTCFPVTSISVSHIMSHYRLNGIRFTIQIQSSEFIFVTYFITYAPLSAANNGVDSLYPVFNRRSPVASFPLQQVLCFQFSVVSSAIESIGYVDKGYMGISSFETETENSSLSSISLLNGSTGDRGSMCGDEMRLDGDSV